MKIQKSKVIWKQATEELSPNALKLLMVMYYQDIEGKAYEIQKALGLSVVPYKKAKDELKNNGYLKMVKVDRYTYKYIVGKDKIAKDDKKYAAKDLIESMIENRMILEGRELTEKEKQETIKDAMEIYQDKKLQEELESMKGIQL